MIQINSGTLKTNRAMSMGTLLKAMKFLKAKGYNACFDECTISFDSACGLLNDALDELVDMFLVEGITLEGEIQYSGDYSGKYEYMPGLHGTVEEPMFLREHTDEKLISELKRRGYRVVKE